MRPTALLQNTPVSKFKDILEIGKDSQTLRPTLYEFLAFRALRTSNRPYRSIKT
ncbi:hypothetical protein NXX40_00400 [Parabacteroides distasonis]|nr:hypothetical protein [Parabacteroides distasonis]